MGIQSGHGQATAKEQADRNRRLHNIRRMKDLRDALRLFHHSGGRIGVEVDGEFYYLQVDPHNISDDMLEMSEQPRE